MITATTTTLLAIAALAAPLATPKAPNTALHATMHPSASANTTTAGASGGGVYGTAHGANGSADRRIVRPGYGEGWLRFGAGLSQLEARITPSNTYLTYRRDVRGPGAAFRLAWAATLGLAYSHSTSVTQRATNSFAVAPSLAAFWLPAADGPYAAARYGFQWQWDLVSYTDDPGESTTVTGTHTAGGAIGWLWRHGRLTCSAELAVLHAWTARVADRVRAYAIVPSLAVQLADFGWPSATPSARGSS